jgi:hypothetical protein
LLTRALWAEHLRNWPLQVDITAIGDLGDTFILKYEINDGSTIDDGVLYQGQKKHIDAKHRVRIFSSAFMNDYQHASIRVNGKPRSPEWTNSGRNDLDDVQTHDYA